MSSSSSSSNEGIKRDFYEVLGVNEDCDDDDLKKAYRKLALVWHPDKNAHRIDEATERFKEIQNAYAVLTDAHERAWYDTHKDEILGKSTGNSGPSELVSIFKVYSQSCYENYDDGSRGFYTVYNQVFKDINSEEKRFASEIARKDGHFDYPEFGTSTALPSVINAFYLYWSTYTSRMHFGWADENNPSEAPNREIRRAMEKDNETKRRQARKERTDEIRALVEFVKKRDKRYILMQIEAKKQAEAAEKARILAKREVKEAVAKARAAAVLSHAAELEARDAEIRASGAFRLADNDSDDEDNNDDDENNNDDDEANNNTPRSKSTKSKKNKKKNKKATVVSPRVVVLRSPLNEETNDNPMGTPSTTNNDNDIEEEEDEAEEIIVCEICRKSFKTVAAMDNHERSKKHLQAVALAKRYQAEEEEEEEEETEEETETMKDETLVQNDNKDDQDNADSNDNDGSSSSEEEEEKLSTNMKNIKIKDNLGKDDNSDNDTSIPVPTSSTKQSNNAVHDSDNDDDEEEDNVPLQKGKGKKQSNNHGPKNGFQDSSDDEAPQANKKKLNKTELRRLRKKEAAEAEKEKKGVTPKDTIGINNTVTTTTTRLPTNTTATVVTATTSTSMATDLRSINPAAIIGGSKGIPLGATLYNNDVTATLGISKVKCATCSEQFDTRNQLFTHIKKTGHAVALQSVEDTTPTSGGGSKATARKDKKDKNKAKRI